MSSEDINNGKKVYFLNTFVPSKQVNISPSTFFNLFQNSVIYCVNNDYSEYLRFNLTSSESITLNYSIRKLTEQSLGLTLYRDNSFKQNMISGPVTYNPFKKYDFELKVP